jgi:hypothetical protein
MNTKAFRWLALGAGAAAGAYAAYAGTTWLRYGHTKRPRAESQDPLLDLFMPEFEVAERHHIEVAAPADVTLAAAMNVDLGDSSAVRAIFKGRELFMGATHDSRPRPRGLLEGMKSIGWSVLAMIPDREVVVGAVTRPWEANVVFRSIPAAEFADFAEPDYVKIAWTLRADPTGSGTSIARTETRVMTTDAASRRKFRRYWSLASPGILLIRRLLLKQVKANAERQSDVERAFRPASVSRV